MHATWTRVAASLLLAAAAHGQPAEPAAPSIGLMYLPPGCLGSGETNINLISVLFDHFDRNPGSVYLTSSGASVLRDGDRWLIRPGTLAAGASEASFLAGAALAPPKREVIESGIPVLDSPFEVVFQHPYDGNFDWLSVMATEGQPRGDFPDVVRRTGDLVRLTDAAGQAMLALELRGDGEPGELITDVLRYERAFSAVARVETPDGHTDLYSLGKRLRSGPRLLAELRARARPDDLRLHPGDATPYGRYLPSELAQCGQTLAALQLDALVPREGELALGPDALKAYAEAHHLPYLAANLQSGPEGARPFPRFRIVERGGLTVALVGLVARDQLARTPAPVRAAWHVEEPRIALGQVTEAIRAQLRRRPDLTVVLLATDGEAYVAAMGTPDFDVLIGPFARGNTMELREETELAAGAAGRATTRYPDPALGVIGNSLALGRVEAGFDAASDGAPPELRRLTHQVWPVLADGPRDEALHAEIRTLEEAGVARSLEVLLPDVAPILEADAALQPLVWGDRILHRTGFREYPRRYPGRFSDPLWMRLVTNVVQDALDVEVVVSRNLPRTSDMVGPLTRDFIDHWLRAPDALHVVTISGERLLELSERLRLQAVEGQVAPTAWLFAAGLDPQRQRIGGRPIDPKEAYRVAVTDYVLDMPDVRSVFADAPQEGRPVPLRAIVEARLETWVAHPTRRDAELVGLLADRSDRLEGRWLLRLDEISLTSARYSNTDNVGKFAASRETRTTTPDNFTLNVAANLGLVYDGPTLAWETRARAALQRLELDIPGQDIPPQEQADDVVLSTELRLNAVALSMGQDRVPLVPFFQVAYDTELTATPDPQPDDPNATFPHQQILRASLGAVTYPGPRLVEVRLGLLVQRDFSAADPHDDFGALAGYRLMAPLLGPLILQSDLDVRYLVDDRDDRPTDLGLVLAAVNKLLVPVAGGVSVFGFADVFLVRGKTEGQREIGGSFVLGGGLQLSRIFKL